ncbi:MAG: very short patch repair endonuclease [Pseudomonadota bacterium]
MTTQTDVFSPQKRSAVMRSVKSANTKPEVTLRKALHAQGLRYRLNVTDLPGKPDILLPKYRTAIFVHGCFWHGHDCKRGAREPKTNVRYWRDKIARNKARDERNRVSLETDGWRVITVWECELRALDIEALAQRIRSDQPRP